MIIEIAKFVIAPSIMYRYLHGTFQDTVLPPTANSSSAAVPSLGRASTSSFEETLGKEKGDYSPFSSRCVIVTVNNRGSALRSGVSQEVSVLAPAH